MSTTGTDRLEKQLLPRAPGARVWRALTDTAEFGAWLRVKLEPESLFSFHWQPTAVDPRADYSREPTTRVEFRLEAVAEDPLLTVVESGFDQLPAGRRDKAFRMNSAGWGGQLINVERHLAG